MLKEVKKDIITASRGVIAHGVNCQHAMGSGVARAIKDRWPKIYEDYINNPCVLGSARLIQVGPELWVANCYTQEYYGRDGKKYADPRAIFSSLREVLAFTVTQHMIDESKEPLDLFVPLIGCGLGGLSYDEDVFPVFEELAWWYPNKNIYICKL